MNASNVLPEFSIAGASAIVTGASRGIGRAIAMAFAEAGADLCLAARSAEALEAVAAEVRGLGRRCIAVPTDVTQEREVDTMARRAIAGLGKVDVLVNNAGVMVVKPVVPLPGFAPPTAGNIPSFFERVSIEEWNRVLDTNLKGSFLCMRALGPHMIERRQGRVINISSTASVKSGRYMASYDASKAALSQLTRSLAVEWARYNITVSAIGAGYVHTELNDAAMKDERLRSRILSEVPLRRLGSEREVALLAVYLASPAAAYLTGQTVYLDGGLLA
jgi:NAD(P)-dependent dehydrogenase (short-subunit alcohol dehydrogenase family)